MGKHKISIHSFVDPAKSNSEEDLFSGLDEDDEPEKESYVESSKQQEAGWYRSTRGEIPATATTGVASTVGGESCQTREDVDDFAEATLKDSGYYPDQGSKYDGLREEGGYDGMKEEGRYDDEDESLTTNDESTLVSVVSGDTRSTLETPGINPAMCPDDIGLGKIIELGKQTGASLDEMNKFLAEELEVDGLAQDMSALKEEVVKHGLEHLNDIDLATLFSKFSTCNSPAHDEHLRLTDDNKDRNTAPADDNELAPAPSDGNEIATSSVDGNELAPPAFAIELETTTPSDTNKDENATPADANEDEKEDFAGTKPTAEAPITSALVSCVQMGVEDAVAEEGMEIPYFSCEGTTRKPTGKKKQAFLSRLLSTPKIRDSMEEEPSPAAKPDVMRVQLEPDGMKVQLETDVMKVPTDEWDGTKVPSEVPSDEWEGLKVQLDDGDMVSVKSTQTVVMRVQLDDGDMASVSKETRTRLEDCQWV